MRKRELKNSMTAGVDLLTPAFLLLTFAASGATRAAASEGNRWLGENRNVVVYADAEEYASFPILARTDQERALLFQVCRFRLEREPVFRPLGSRSAGCGANRLLGLGGRKSPGNWRSGDAAEVDGSRRKGELVSSGPEVELIASSAAGEAAVDVPLKIHGEPRRQDGWAVP